MSQEVFRCKRCETGIGIVVENSVLIIADLVVILSVVKLRCFKCKALTTFRPSRKPPDPVLTRPPVEATMAG
jgi:hypothetical protein